MHGEPGRNLAELGVGTNDRATLTGNVLEDEKILGTVHVAFGASAGIGGTVSVPIHLDVVVLDASLEVDGEPVLEQGRWVLAALTTLLAIPNVSEGRDPGADRRDRASRRMLACSTSTRIPITTAACSRSPARPASCAGHVLDGAREAIERIDISEHFGDPSSRRGDRRRARSSSLTTPIVGPPCAEALVLADRLGDELDLPVFLYGILADGRTRAELRRGGPRALAARIDGRRAAARFRAQHDFTPPPALCSWRPGLPWSPSTSSSLPPPPRPTPSGSPRRSGRAALEGSPASGRSGCGWPHRECAQVSTNVEDHRGVPLVRVIEAVGAGAEIAEAELVGLAPRAAFEGFPDDLVIRNRRTVEDALAATHQAD